MGDVLEYSVGDHPDYHEADSRFDFPSKARRHFNMMDFLAEDLAEDFFHNHDGWESSWPQELRVWKNGECVGVFDVDCEAAPSFSATKRKAEE